MHDPPPPHHHLHLPLPLPLHVPSNPSMVVIRHAHGDDTTDSCVFPPVNHENLQVFPHSHHHHHPIPQSPPSSSSPSSSSSSSSSCSFSPSDSDTSGLPSPSPSDSQVGKRGDFLRWMSVGVEILRSKLFAAASPFRSGASRRGAFWSIWVPAAAVVMSCWIVMRRKRNRRRGSLTPNETRLLDIIKQKDERIAQLLHQIAQMNEILIARHKALAGKSGRMNE